MQVRASRPILPGRLLACWGQFGGQLERCSQTFDRPPRDRSQRTRRQDLPCHSNPAERDGVRRHRAIVSSIALAVLIGVAGCSSGQPAASEVDADSTITAVPTTSPPTSSVVVEPSTMPPTSSPAAKPQATSPPTTPPGPSAAELAAQREAAYQQQQLALFNQCMSNAQKSYDDQVASENRYKDSMQRLNQWSADMERVHQQTLTTFLNNKARSEQTCSYTYNYYR